MIDVKSPTHSNRMARSETMLRLPNFVVLGPPRTATTWLFRCLDDHPQVFVPNIKEARFFDERYGQGLPWYQSLYQEVPADVVAIGDITPGYFITPAGPERIQETLGQSVKLFVIVRDPVERAYSHYKMLRRSGLVPADFYAALKSNRELIENSLYAKHIERYLAYFPAEAVRLLHYNTLMNAPEIYFKRILNELGVAAVQSKTIHERINYAVSESVSPKLVRTTTALRQVIEQNKIGRIILWRLRDAGIMQKWHKLTARKHEDRDELTGQQRIEIYQQYFANDVAKLQAYQQQYIA